MLITTSSNTNSFRFGSVPASSSSTLSISNAAGKLSDTVAEHPILFATDALDLGAGVTTALGGLDGAGGSVLEGTAFILGGYHAVKSFVHLISGANEAADGMTPTAKQHFTMAVGEGLSAAGQFCAVAGVGPVSLGFLGLGLLMTNASSLSR